ncbi:hypothetical protein [uncultured Microbulbifer sp.]|uniref:hypothetical protein n=1 Tax=uncultured Microbulbifer sp. TaxID=348147 RepID=UPI0026350F40|nr:hypothetical protein [uncultured Microbulbifer sp.]
MFFECEDCLKQADIEIEDLPDHACDDVDLRCENCGVVFIVGWEAVIEIRGRK